MADEIDSGASASEMIQAEILSRQIIQAAYAPSVMLPLVRRESLVGQPTLTGEYTKHPVLTAAALTDGTAVANTAYDPTSVTCLAAEVGITLEMTDLYSSGAIININNLAMEAGRSVANKIDTDLLAEVADLTTTDVGATTVNLLNSDILSGIYTIKNGNLQDRGPIHGVLHPIQVFDWMVDLETNVTSTPFGAESMAASAPFSTARSFSMYGITWHESTLCAAVNTAADRQGVIFPAGQQSAFVFQVKWDPRAEMERDAKMRSWSVVATAAYGDECIDTVGGVAVVSDHE
jgi:hypothetical protein